MPIRNAGDLVGRLPERSRRVLVDVIAMYDGAPRAAQRAAAERLAPFLTGTDKDVDACAAAIDEVRAELQRAVRGDRGGHDGQ